MYIVIRNRKQKKQSICINELSGFLFGISNHSYRVNDTNLRNLVIYNKKLAYPICYKQTMKKFDKLIKLLPDLLVSDDDGQSIRHALNEIERFRQIIKNKYRKYLKKKDLEHLSKKLEVFQKVAQEKMYEIQLSYYKSNSKGTSK